MSCSFFREIYNQQINVIPDPIDDRLNSEDIIVEVMFQENQDHPMQTVLSGLLLLDYQHV